MPDNPYEAPKEGLQGYPELVSQFARQAESIASPADFYRLVRSEGFDRMTAMLLLRDLFNLNLKECMEVDAKNHGPSDC